MDSQPPLKRILLIGFFVALLTLPFAFNAAAQECPYPEYCPSPEAPGEPPPSGGGGEPPSGNNSSGAWSGFSDGRLNPDMAEYYSVWCANDQIEVWGGRPSPQLITNVPLVRVLQMGEVSTIDIGAGITLSRTGDIIVLSGSNGNNAPAAGTKVFTLGECIGRNGGAPALPPTPTRTPTLIGPTPVPTRDPAESAQNITTFCIFFNAPIEDVLDCLADTNDVFGEGAWYYVSWFMAMICSSGILPLGMVAAVPTAHLWRRRRSRKQKPNQ